MNSHYDEDKIDRIRRALRKEQIINQSLFELVLISDRKKELSDIFALLGVNSIAVYGMGKVGVAFYQLLVETSVDIKYCVDKNEFIEWNALDIRHSLDDMTDDVDMIIVTVDIGYEKIKAEIMEKVNVPIVLLRDLVEGLLLIPDCSIS